MEEVLRATRKQLYAISCYSNLDTRNLEITYHEAQELIENGKRGVDISLLVKIMLRGKVN
jgi:hypothetical protein